MNQAEENKSDADRLKDKLNAFKKKLKLANASKSESVEKAEPAVYKPSVEVYPVETPSEGELLDDDRLSVPKTKTLAESEGPQAEPFSHEALLASLD